MTELSSPDIVEVLRSWRKGTPTNWYGNVRLDSAIAEIERLRASLQPATPTAVNCARFVRWALQEGPWQGGGLDGGEVQEKAESLGLIVSVPYDPEKHGAYNDYGCDAGDQWFDFSAGLNAVRTPPAADTVAGEPFYGAQCPTYPDCNGGCGLGCTHEIEQARVQAATTPEPVAYRVKDYGDGWILCHTPEEAAASADGMIQPLFLNAAQEPQGSQTLSNRPPEYGGES